MKVKKIATLKSAWTSRKIVDLDLKNDKVNRFHWNVGQENDEVRLSPKKAVKLTNFRSQNKVKKKGNVRLRTEVNERSRKWIRRPDNVESYLLMVNTGHSRTEMLVKKMGSKNKVKKIATAQGSYNWQCGCRWWSSLIVQRARNHRELTRWTEFPGFRRLWELPWMVLRR